MGITILNINLLLWRHFALKGKKKKDLPSAEFFKRVQKVKGHLLKFVLFTIISVSVQDVAMLRYIRDRTAAPYFSNLVWFIGSHILDLDICVRNDAE